jgi:3-hydroxyisobutyrate dehydrogenase
MEKIGVIGLGRMGSAIALRMQSQGHPVTGWTRSGRTIDGVTTTSDIADLAAQSDTLILSLLDDTAVGTMLDALLACDIQGKQIIETSTVVPTLIQDRIARIQDKGATAVDAPISGGPELVAAGACGVFIGGDDDAAARAQKTMQALSGRIFHVGPLGSGLVMKTINNSILQYYFSGMNEMMPLAKRAGLPLKTVLGILCGGPAGVPMVRDRIPKILGEDTSVGFTIAAGRKDNDVFQRVAEAYGLATPLMAFTGERQDAAIAAGMGELDPAALISAAFSKA